MPAVTLGMMVFQSMSRATRAPNWRAYLRRAGCHEAVGKVMDVAALRKTHEPQVAPKW